MAENKKMREMKDSGIEWVGKIPNDWAIKPLYCFFSERKNKNILGKEDNLLSLSYGKVIRKDINTNEGLLPSNYNGYNIVEAGDIVIRPTDLQNDQRSLRTGLVTERGIITWAYIALKPLSNINSRFYHYLLHTYDTLKVFYNMGGGVRQGLNYDEFAKLKIYSPSSSEQQRIADFLDRECGKIDSIIVDIQKQTELLEKYKRSVIFETVTKGLDHSVQMKDSGIDYIGTIPECWTIEPLFIHFREGKKKNVACKEENLLSLSYGKVIRKDINSAEGLLPASFSSYNVVSEGDIIIRPTDLQNDKRSLRTGLVKEKGIITSAYIDLIPFKGVNSRYYQYLLHVYDIVKTFYNMGNGVRQGLNYDEFSKLLVLSPPKQEQQAIADYLDKKCAEIDGVIADKKKQLDVLENYKKSIIYEYVTGKKEA